MRMLRGSATASPLREGRRRLAIKAPTGEEIGIDLAPDAAARLAAELGGVTATIAPAVAGKKRRPAKAAEES